MLMITFLWLTRGLPGRYGQRHQPLSWGPPDEAAPLGQLLG